MRVIVRKAILEDYGSIIELLDNATEEDKKFLGYVKNKHINSQRQRILKNLLEEHIVVFVVIIDEEQNKEKIYGLLEYSIRSDNVTWIHTLYTSHAYRHPRYRREALTFKALQEAYKFPIRFMVKESNRNMRSIVERKLNAKLIFIDNDHYVHYIIER